MATRETYKALAQSNPVATTLTDVYTVPVSTTAVLSSIIVANRGARSTFRIAIAVGGAADSLEQYIAYDTPLTANGVQEFTVGITLNAGDVVRVYVENQQFSFSMFGAEISNV